MTATRQIVNLVSYNDGTHQVCQSVKAIVIGPLAVHRELDNDYKWWAVSHVRTGCRVKGLIRTRGRAIRIANALQFLDWNFRSPKSSKVKAMAEKVAWAINCTT